ncbi:DUF4184 family protein [Microbacterium allomyrinae]|uniref:DUF4184 family protein n=1 Tax=Microbacterium allomyrinae TaxID=2830666 RepID=A0A9X1LZ43_9MICO|nr:DUF4184 family protein [Microbacterium allomyrinae]MCC2033890.1 DUF4184 family protein [Microbacterium allomyrinae]
MPFTPSHAVVALPFVRTPLVPAAIAIGAMTPDLPLFVRGLPLGGLFGLDYGRTHAFSWLPATMLVALALLLLWRCVLRPATRELSPGWLARRLPGEWDAGAIAGARETFAVSGVSARASWRGTVLLLLSLAIGIATHIVWDLFTHEGRWGTSVLPVLADQWGPFPGYKWLQHGSSTIGLAILATWTLWWLVRRDDAAEPGRRAAPGSAPAPSGAGEGAVVRVLPASVRWTWWLSLPVALIVGWVWGLAAFGPLDAEFTAAHLGYRMLPPACAVWGMLTLLVCVVVQAARRR